MSSSPFPATSDPGRALRVAAINGDTATAVALLETMRGAGGVDAPDHVGFTPLILAARHGHLPMVRLLCEQGADVNSRSQWGDTPLHSANDKEIIITLLNYGCRVTTGLIMKAVRMDDEALLHLLLDRSRQEMSPLHPSHAWPSSLDAASLLCESVRVGEKENYWIDWWLRQGANVNVSYGPGNFTPLMQAAGLGEVECTRLLLDAGADPNAVTGEGYECPGRSALMFAAQLHYDLTGNLQPDATVNLLLERGADPNLADEHGFTALHHAVARDRRGMEPFPGSDEAILTAAERVTRSLIQQGADVNAATAHGLTPLHMTYSGSCVRWLLAAGAQIEARDGLYQEWTPLLWAASEGRSSAVQALLEAGANVHAVDPTAEETALTLALRAYKRATDTSILRDYPDAQEIPRIEATIALIRQGLHLPS